MSTIKITHPIIVTAKIFGAFCYRKASHRFEFEFLSKTTSEKFCSVVRKTYDSWVEKLPSHRRTMRRGVHQSVSHSVIINFDPDDEVYYVVDKDGNKHSTIHPQ